jgi:hypothetical protein
MKQIALSIILLAATNLFSQQPVWDWGKGAGGAGNDFANDIATTPSGDSYAVGSMSATATFGPHIISSYAGPDIFVAKYDNTGNCLWARNAGSLDTQDLGGDGGYSVGVDAAGNCYVTGIIKGTATFGSITIGTGSMRNIFLAKYDPNGNVIWAKCPSGGTWNNYAKAITVDATGNSYITGFLGGGSVTFGAFTLSGSGGFVVKYSTGGTVLYATKIGSNGGLDFFGIAHDNFGNVYATGYLQSSETIGSQTFTSNGTMDAALIKLDPSGNFQWLQHNKPSAGHSTYGSSVCCDQNGDAYICGKFDNTTIFGNDTLVMSGMGNTEDAYLAKYNAAGNLQWAVQTDVIGFSSLKLAFYDITSNGTSVYVTGVFSDDVMLGSVLLTNNSGENTFVAEYDLNGNCVFALPSTGQNPRALGFGISVDAANSVYITGISQGEVVFGNDTAMTNAVVSLFIAKINQSANSVLESTTDEKEFNCFYQTDADQIVLNINTTIFSENKIEFTVLDITGRVLIQLPIINSTTKIPIGNFPPGIYIWMVSEFENKLSSGKILK